MAESLTPLQVAQALLQISEQIENPAHKEGVHEGAETVLYLLALLKECASYIEDVKEYDLPPRFIIAVREALA